MTVTMKANRIHRFGGPEVILFEDVPRPTPGTSEVLVRVHTAGVGPWDAQVRAGRSALPQPLPHTLGADLGEEAQGLRGTLDTAIDTVGGKAQRDLFAYVRKGGTLISSVSVPDAQLAQECGIDAKFILLDVNTEDLEAVADLPDAQQLVLRIGQVLALGDARRAHEMLEGLRPLPAG
jgi:NADPH:quinone reductase-like Zn-dependent oxidoreductase